MWFLFIVLVFLLLNVFNLSIIYKNIDLKNSAKNMDLTKKTLSNKIDLINKRIGFILRQKAVSQEIYANNIVLKDSMKNLFDLVPDKITLKKVIIGESSLVIYGTTPTKDTYNFLLGAPFEIYISY